jgi:uracil-DNA glycosylase family 4
MAKPKIKTAPEYDRDALQVEFEQHAFQQGLEVEVFSDGPINSRIAIVGEGPGESEVRQGLPWVGNAGKLLWDSVRKYGLHRANTYVTNVVKRQISLSRKGNERNIVHRDELDQWIGLVRWELEQLKDVRIIFAMGNYALEACTDEVGISNWRGSVLKRKLPNGELGYIVCTFNPAYAQRELKMEPIFISDCHKLDMVNRGVFKEYQIEHIINPSFRMARDFIRGLRASSEAPCLDIETINGETACIGLSNDPHLAMCLNWRDGIRNRFTVQEEADLLLDLQELCDSHRVVAQNGQFDAYWLRLKDWLSITVGFDTLLAHHTLYPQLPHSLAFLVSQYTTHPFYKDEGKKWKEGDDIDAFWRYNCKDAALTLAVKRREQKELEQQGLADFFHNHVMRAAPHLTSATVHGLKVDLAHKERVKEAVGVDVNNSLEEIYRIIHELLPDEDPNYRPNIGSWQQMQVLYFKKLKLQGRGYSTDATNREHMMKHPGTSLLAKDLLAKIEKWSEENKFLGTYANARPGTDGRMRCEYKQYGVSKAPGRLSSSGLLTGEGLNLQNQPERAKEMYEADPGCVFGYFDLSQAEARVVAYRANIEKWKEQFEQARLDGKFDCHRALASEMFKVPYDQVPLKDFDADLKPTIRYTSKRCRHGLNYRMERFRLSEVTGLPYHEAARAFFLYHSITPELEEWWKQAERDFRTRKEVFNAFGRRHKVIQRIDDEVLKSIVAFYPQSTIGDKITRVWYQAEEDDRWPMDARVCIDVHDNLVCMASPKTIKTALKVLKGYAEEPIMVQDAWHNAAQPLIIPADTKVSYPVLWDKRKDEDPKSKTYNKEVQKFWRATKEDIARAAKKQIEVSHRWGFLEAIDIAA